MHKNGMTSQNKPQHCWTNSDKAELVKVLSIIVKGQNAYGKNHNLEHMLEYFQFKLQKDFTVEQVIYAIDKYTDRKDDIPTPADVRNLLDPEEPKVTHSQFIAAQEWQKRNQNWSEFTDAYDTIAAYERQNAKQREDYKIDCQQIASIARNSVKRIGS